jgi:TPP-dependent pyruvate/acetoin dehydrogenase alpha subunit
MSLKEKEIKLYSDILLIRKFEELVLNLFSKGKLFGTTHTYVGQEANATGVINNLSEEDTIFTNHRCHGHYLVSTHDVTGLLSELMGKKSGVCAGIGGSQHICADNFFSNGVQGSFMPISVGMAFTEKINKTNNIVTAFIGDGTLGEGTVYESFNLMSLLNVPLLVVIENNMYAQTTPVAKSLAGSIKKRSESFDIKTTEINSFNVLEINEVSKKIINEIRDTKKPQVLIINTYRFNAHSKGDDYRDADEINKYKQFDPLKIAGKNIDEETKININKEIDLILNKALEFAENSEFPDINYINEIFRIIK